MDVTRCYFRIVPIFLRKSPLLGQGEPDRNAPFRGGIAVLVGNVRIVDDLVEEEPKAYAFAQLVIDGGIDGDDLLAGRNLVNVLVNPSEDSTVVPYREIHFDVQVACDG